MSGWDPSRYHMAPANPSPADLMRSAEFGPAVRRAFQGMGRVDVTPYAIPWSGVDLPLVDDLPNSPNERAEVNLVVGDGIARMVFYRGSWRQIGATIVTALPEPSAALVEGIEVHYLTTAGFWSFVYYPSGDPTYPWQFTGGPPLNEAVQTSENTTSTSYTDLATAGPDLAVPLDGTYEISYGVAMGNGSAEYCFASPKFAAAATSDDHAIYAFTGAAFDFGGFARTHVGTLSASDVVQLEYKVSGGTGAFSRRWLSISPVKVST